MSRSKNTGKRVRMPQGKLSLGGAGWMVTVQTKTWGSTQRIRRKHRQMWGRMLSRVRRAEGKRIIERELDG